MQTPEVLLITDAAYEERVVLDVLEAAARALPVGTFAVQLRDKLRSARPIALCGGDASVRPRVTWARRSS